MNSPSMHRYRLAGTILFLAVCFTMNSCSKEANTSVAAQNDALSSETSLRSLSASAGIDTSALVAWYSFDSGSLKDKSSFHNNIKFNNAVPAADRNGVANNAYYFGGNSYMRVKNSASLNPATGITLFAIVKVSDFYAGKCHGNRILGKGYTPNQQGVYYMLFDDGYATNQMACSQDVEKDHENFSAAYGDLSSGRYDAEGDTLAFVQTDHWYHLVYTYAKGVGSYYVDGVLTQRATNRASFTANGDDLYIGALDQRDTEYPYYFTGTIDQIGIFNTALNEQQVARLSKY